MIRHARAGLTSVALAAALLGSIAAPAGAIPRPDARIASTPAVLEASSHGAGPLRNLPTSLLVTLRRGVGPEAADAIAAGHELVRVAWNPMLRTAQYMATTGSTDPGSLATAALVARRVDGGARDRLLALGRDLRGAQGVVAVAAPVQLKVAEAPAGIAGAAGALPAAASAADAAAPDPTPTPVPAPMPTPVIVPSPVAPPNDTYWAAQWGLEAVGIRSAWAITRGRPEIVVAVVDTGVDASHPDLAGRLIPGTDIGDGDSNPNDAQGHGTHVAGIIAATSGNARGVSGAAPAVVVMPVKVMDSQGNIWDTAVAEGIAWAVARGARVVNLSLGGDKASAAINAAVDNARGHGVVVVAAAGNNGSGVSQPGAYGPVLAVAAVEDRPASLDANHDGLRDGCGVARFGPGDYRHAPYSNVGPEVDIAAPGSCVLSTVPVASGRSYASLDGTSMATPFVSAAAALVLSRDPSLAAAQVEAALVGTAADIGTSGPDPETGTGVLRADAAVASISAPPSDGQAPTVSWSGLTDGTVVRGPLTIRSAAGDASPIVATRIYRDGRLLYVRRTATVAIAWNTAGVADGLHSWSAYATDSGLLAGSAPVRVLVANHRTAIVIASSAKMTARVRSIVRAVTLIRRSPFVARSTGPSGAWLVLRLVDRSGRIVAEARGTGTAVIAVSSLRQGRYRLRAVTPIARPGLSLRLRAAWLR